jgi:predicted N-formylglutamate amidohydrolase
LNDLLATMAAGHPASDVLVSCEHGGREVPPRYATLFAGQEALLASHRGWDPGTLQLAQQLAHDFGAPLHAATTTRLLIDLNRSIGHRQLFSSLSATLDRSERDAIVAAHYRPHRDAIEHDIAGRVASGHRVVHVAVHSFAPVLGGRIRHADLAWLYDPRRAGEAELAQRWLSRVAVRQPGLALRRNYPYRGSSDGLTAQLRKRFDAAHYVGIEFEVNQRFVESGGTIWERLCADVIGSLDEALGPARA